MKIYDKHPPAHKKYVVKRDGVFYTATPCYGLHYPWWVVRIMGKNYEAPPAEMNQNDEWWPLEDCKISST